MACQRGFYFRKAPQCVASLSSTYAEQWQPFGGANAKRARQQREPA